MEKYMHQALRNSSSAPDGLTAVKNAQSNCIPPSTLHHRLHGRLTRRRGYISQQLMSVEESEEGLVDILNQ